MREIPNPPTTQGVIINGKKYEEITPRADKKEASSDETTGDEKNQAWFEVARRNRRRNQQTMTLTVVGTQQQPQRETESTDSALQAAVVAMLRFVTLVALLAASSAVDNPTVQLTLGVLRGTRLKYEGRAYHAYRGVPYAEPPERFKEATRKRPWSGMLDATEDGPSCLQHDAYVDDGDGAEYKGDTDCLFLNVYTPAVKGERGFPIIVYIHGGGYTSGHAGSEWVNPQYFMLKDVVVVTVAYRLGVFGFLCTGDEQALANLGLRDQALALRWVRAHGPAFGGAADRVTLMGHDAGAASVHLHMLAPASRGLFSRAISQSGVWLDWWLGAQQPRQAAATVRALAALLGCYWEPPSLMPCLRRKPVRQLFNATAQFQFWSIEPLSLFRPCVDAATASPFLPVDPLQLLEDGQVASVPWLLGVTSDQGLFRLADPCKDYEMSVELSPMFVLDVVALLHSRKASAAVELQFKSELECSF
ncbi:juvenile hormone esterase-like [Schistocerca gregaria]|uniref:juvenile hormone esterase-like n=1 Tax=Schistocerca gregaria TaxID=7010 RepID=UPI00211EAC84|nr:juvenile hormone esterase-like [Schistocerca gregaria]